MINQRFPPGASAGARRFSYLANKWARNGEVYVIRRDNGQPGGHGPATEVISISAKDLRTATGNQGAAPSKKKDGFFIGKLLTARQAFPFLLLTDDGGIDYRAQAYRAACAVIDRVGITRIYSSFRPWSDHLIARRLKKKYPDLQWIADFRDHPVDPVRKDVWWPALQTRWGRGVIATADEMWVVSEGQMEQFSGWHPHIMVRRNALLYLPPAQTEPATSLFTIVYTGSCYPGLQSLSPLVDALAFLIKKGEIDPNKLQLIYRGKDGDLFQKWTSRLPANSLDIQPNIAPAAAQKLQKNAQLLLLLNWSAPNYYGVLTAKLWDYLATGRPIIALVNGPIDPELQEIIEGAAAGTVYGEENVTHLQQRLLDYYRTWAKEGAITNLVDVEKLKGYL